MRPGQGLLLSPCTAVAAASSGGLLLPRQAEPLPLLRAESCLADKAGCRQLAAVLPRHCTRVRVRVKHCRVFVRRRKPSSRVDPSYKRHKQRCLSFCESFRFSLKSFCFQALSAIETMADCDCKEGCSCSTGGEGCGCGASCKCGPSCGCQVMHLLWRHTRHVKQATRATRFCH